MTDHATQQSLAGKVALVTGSARRVGAEVARALHRHGASVVLHFRGSELEARHLARELEGARPGSARVVQADILKIPEIERLVDAAVAAFGQLDVLVNNASTFYPTPMGSITEAQWDDLIGTNLKAPLFLAQRAAPALRAARGLVLNIADIHGKRPLRRHPVYSIAKAGLIMLTRSLARELAPEVRVNAIAPGPVLWPESGVDDARKEDIVSRTLLKRTGTPDDIARAAVFFAAEAQYVTGQVLAVDGGRSIRE